MQNSEHTDCRIVHLLVLNRVLIYHNARNEKYVQYGTFMNVAMIYTVTGHDTVFYSVRHNVLTQVLMKITPCQMVKCYGHFGGT
jgi:hypothetical protein